MEFLLGFAAATKRSISTIFLSFHLWYSELVYQQSEADIIP